MTNWSNLGLRSFKYNRRFGIELEVGGEYDCWWIANAIGLHSTRQIVPRDTWGQSINNRSWHVKKDATCGGYGRGYDYGWEIASPVGRTAEDLSHFGHVAESLKQDGLMVNGNCGLHVHVEVMDWGEEEAGRFMSQWLRVERVLMHSVPDRRRENTYCRPCRPLIDHRKKFHAPEEVYEAYRPRSLKSHFNTWRRYTINWVNFEIALEKKGNHGRKTLELRLPEGSLNRVDVVNWPKLVLRLAQRSDELPFAQRTNAVELQEVISILGLGNEGDTFMVLDEDCFYLKHWLLRRIMLYSPDGAMKSEANLLLNSMWSPALSFTKIAPAEVFP
jgi:hypothetical protein